MEFGVLVQGKKHKTAREEASDGDLLHSVVLLKKIKRTHFCCPHWCEWALASGHAAARVALDNGRLASSRLRVQGSGLRVEG